MKRYAYRSLGAILVLWTLTGTGCGLQRLKESNLRLKSANDRLASENNRLEEEVAVLQRQLAQGESAPAPDAPLLTSANPAPAAADLSAELLVGDDVTIDRTPLGVRFTVPDRVFFALGQATLTEKGRTTLDKIASLIRANYPGKTIRVDGHTDDTPIRKVAHKYPTNWELSTARACTVVRYLVDRGANPQKIYPAGFSYYRPVGYGKTSGEKDKNRRVEITVLDGAI